MLCSIHNISEGHEFLQDLLAIPGREGAAGVSMANTKEGGKSEVSAATLFSLSFFCVFFCLDHLVALQTPWQAPHHGSV